LIRARIIYSATCTLVTILNGQGNHKDSDFDIYVVIPDDSMRPIEAMQKTGRALSRKDIRAVDVIGWQGDCIQPNVRDCPLQKGRLPETG